MLSREKLGHMSDSVRSSQTGFYQSYCSLFFHRMTENSFITGLALSSIHPYFVYVYPFFSEHYCVYSSKCDLNRLRPTDTSSVFLIHIKEFIRPPYLWRSMTSLFPVKHQIQCHPNGQCSDNIYKAWLTLRMMLRDGFVERDQVQW